MAYWLEALYWCLKVCLLLWLVLCLASPVVVWGLRNRGYEDAEEPFASETVGTMMFHSAAVLVLFVGMCWLATMLALVKSLLGVLFG